MNTYDEVEYTGYPFRQAHPDRMAVVGRLLGLDPAPARRCRVLELGCGDGGNLIPMALAFPESEFTGVDLAEKPVARGRAVVEELRLRNIRLVAMDLSEIGPTFGEYDYVIAYGLYSWAPGPVRRKILQIARANLAPHGVAYVNYNAYPGGHVRVMLRDMMLYHVRGIEDPAGRVSRARDLLKTLSESPALADEYGALVKAEAARLLAREGAFLYHDELSEIFQPVYFHEFMKEAGACGLQYLAESTLSDTHTVSGPMDEWLERFPDFIEREQHFDFMKFRTFRHTLLCRSEAPLDRSLRTAVVADLSAACNATVATSNGETEFKTTRATLRTAHPVACAVLTALAKRWPQAVRTSELVRNSSPDATAVVCSILLRAFTGGLVELYGTPPSVAAAAEEKPFASSLARIQARSGDKITTLLHTYVSVRDDMARRLLTLLDGTRDRAALLDELVASGADRDQTAMELERTLAGFVRLGLLVP